MLPIEVLYEHSDFVVVSKPAGIPVQNGESEEGLLPILCRQLDLPHLWLVHRLDKVTSGILILAKNPKAAATFGELFENKQIEKYYLAIAPKKPQKKQGTVKGGMKKVRDGKWILDNNANNIAITQFFSFGVLPKIRLFIVKPLTGKTHQIRVALKSLGSPILGDTHYKGEMSDRTYLHAYIIRFSYQKVDISVSCHPTLGSYFNHEKIIQAISDLEMPWSLNWPQVKHPSPKNE